MRTKEIYDGLIARWGTACNDEPWIRALKKDYSIKDDEWTPDRFFLITLSWGPWTTSRQMAVWNNVKNVFPEVANDIRKAGGNFKGFPLSWQNERVRAISEYLIRESKTFTDIITDLKSLNGPEARDKLAIISGASQNKKTISCFIRDFLLKDTFPIDSRISEMLSCLGLPNNEDQIIQLCERDKVSSRVLDRMLYAQWENCPSQVNAICEKCKIKDYCWEYILTCTLSALARFKGRGSETLGHEN